MLDANLQKYVSPDDASFDGSTLMVHFDFDLDDEPLCFERVEWERCEGSVYVEAALLDGKRVKRERIIHLIGIELLTELEDAYADELIHSGDY